MKIFARLLLVIFLLIWLGPAALAFLFFYFLIIFLVVLAGWDKEHP